ATRKIQRRKKRQQEAVLRWIRNEPRIMIPEKRVGSGEESWKNDYAYYQEEIEYITEDVPEQTYPQE
ncbi:hypothetical protein A2U01_0105824, partial [Trifolium medium]|nr:hypothetical protein [Trifolium medium]